MTFATVHALSSPQTAYRFCQRLYWPVMIAMCLFVGYGLIGGLYFAPADYQQGDGFRILYVHVPSALLSLGIYTFMSACALIGLVWRIKLAFYGMQAAALLGASMTLLALITGMIWGKPMWGTFWVWDARLTSELILFFLYLGFMALHQAIPNPNTANKASAILLLMGLVDIPIIHFSVNWWFTLHQGESLSLFHQPSIAEPMLYPLLSMILGFTLLFIWLFCQRLQTVILRHEHKTKWATTLIKATI